MISIQVKSKRDPAALAELIASTQDEVSVDPKLAAQAQLLRDHRAEEARSRPSRQTLDTLNFEKLDDANDWTDL